MSAGEVYYADDGTVSMVLDAKVDPNYEPSKDELHEYASWLGIDPEKEPELMFIAREGLKAPLPDEWKPCKTDTGDVYYFNFTSGESIWEHPLDEHFKGRVADARAKVKAGIKVGPEESTKDARKSSAKESREKKEKKKEKKHEKGSAGNEPATSAAPASGKLPLAAPLKTGRLGALGSDSASSRPDITGLVPSAAASSVPKAFAIPSKEDKQSVDPAAEDQRLRETLRAEHDERVAEAKEKHERQLVEKRSTLERERSRLERELAATHEEEVDEAKRAAERRTRRELQMFEESIDRQIEDLRRTLKQERARLDAESAAVDARVEAELATKRKSAEAAIEAKVNVRQAELRSEWHNERNAAEASLERALADQRREISARIDAATVRENARADDRLSSLHNELSAELARSREAHAAEHQRVVAELHAASSSGTTSSPEYAAAEANYSSKVAAAKERASAQASTLRQEFAAKRRALVEKHAVDLAAAKAKSSGEREAHLRLVEGQMRSDAQARLAEARRANEVDIDKRKSKFEEDTCDAVEREREQVLGAINEKHAARAAEVRAATERHEKELQTELDALRLAHETRMADARAGGGSHDDAIALSTVEPFEARQRRWTLEHPRPKALPMASSDGEPPDVVAAKATIQSDCESQVRAVEAKLDEERGRAVAAHRASAKADMEKRLGSYEAERRRRAEAAIVGASTTTTTTTIQRAVPERRVVQASSLSAESEQQLAAERARLQARLDGLALELAGSSHPPRHSSAISRDLPNLRSSGSSRFGSNPPSPQRHAPRAVANDSREVPEASASMPHDARASHERRLRRIAKAKERIRAEKRSVRTRQEELEEARAEWRRDMRAAKLDGDTRQQQLLHVAKGVLEERARVLNSDTVALNQSIDLVKQEERRLGLRDASDGARMYDMLKDIACKVEKVESKIHRAPDHGTRETSHREHARDRDRSRRAAATADKWQRYMRPPSQGSNRHVDVETWLAETSA